jgi:hypothetical protein
VLRQVEFLFLVLVHVGQASFGQPQLSLSPKHITKIQSATTGTDRLKLYRKYFSRDSAKHVRRLEKLHKKKWDSLVRVARKTGRSPIKEYVPEELPVSLALDMELIRQEDFSSGKTLADSTVSPKLRQHLVKNYGLSDTEVSAFISGDTLLRRRVQKRAGELLTPDWKQMSQGQVKQLELVQKTGGAYSKEAIQYVAFLKDSVHRLDSMKVIAEAQAESAALQIESSLASMGNLSQLNAGMKELDDYRSSMEEYRDIAADLKNPEDLKKEAVEQLVDQREKLKGLSNRITGLKGKFATLLNSNDLSTGIKAKSLAGRPVRERWVIGGNFNIVSTAPFMLDLGLQFGYRIDKRFQVGVSGIYRATFVDTVNWSNAISPERYGYGAFASYGLMGNFFGYTEWERTASVVRSGADQATTAWVSSFLVGIGRKFNLHPKVSGSLLILGNLLHENGQSPYHSPLVIKTGFQLTPLALMKR